MLTFTVSDTAAGFTAFTPIPHFVAPGPTFVPYFVVALLLSSIIITGIGTSLIILRILFATRDNPSVSHPAVYRRIQRIVAESGVIYSFSMFITGITLAIAVGLLNEYDDTSGEPCNMLDSCMVIVTYSEALLTPLAVSPL